MTKFNSIVLSPQIQTAGSHFWRRVANQVGVFKHLASYAPNVTKVPSLLFYTNLYIPLQFFSEGFDRLCTSIQISTTTEGDLE